jgi:hypothetical protein
MGSIGAVVRTPIKAGVPRMARLEEGSCADSGLRVKL